MDDTAEPPRKVPKRRVPKNWPKKIECDTCHATKNRYKFRPNKSRTQTGRRSTCNACEKRKSFDKTVPGIVAVKGDLPPDPAFLDAKDGLPTELLSFQKITPEKFNELLESRMQRGGVSGFMALIQLAELPLDYVKENAMLGQVKLLAAQKLVSFVATPLGAGPAQQGGDTPHDQLMKSLKEAFDKHAPRLRIQRETVTFEPDERPALNGEASPLP